MNNHTQGCGQNSNYRRKALDRHLSNFGCLIADIPPALFAKLCQETSVAEEKNSSMESGLTGNGVPAHFDLKNDHRQELDGFVMSLVKEYLATFPNYSENFKLLTNNSQLVCSTPWFNFQKKHEFVPNHTHDGVLSYSAWIKIPYHKDKEHTYGKSFAGCFEFTYRSVIGTFEAEQIFIDKSFEGKLLMFPSHMSHCVYPFYSSNETRISMSGNVLFDTYKSRIEI